MGKCTENLQHTYCNIILLIFLGIAALCIALCKLDRLTESKAFAILKNANHSSLPRLLAFSIVVAAIVRGFITLWFFIPAKLNLDNVLVAANSIRSLSLMIFVKIFLLDSIREIGRVSDKLCVYIIFLGNNTSTDFFQKDGIFVELRIELKSSLSLLCPCFFNILNSL